MSDHYEIQIGDLKEQIAELENEIKRLNGLLCEIKHLASYRKVNVKNPVKINKIP